MVLKVVEVMDSVEPHKIGIGASLWALFWMCTIIGLPYAAYIIRGGSIAKRNLELIQEVNSKAQTAFKSYIGAEPKYLDTATVNKDGLLTGSGIAYLDGSIYFMEAGRATQFSPALIRDFQYKAEGYAPITIVGANNVGQQLQVDLINQQEAHKAHVNSGLFLTIADIEYPEWHLMTTDVVMLKRWHEILQQVREGVL